ncbi:MAG: FAD-dependent oxidoreductase [Actinobacteria bacterium]|nr:FAD-dependent oxidoreductase [Actinomycetota bacterium]
MTSKRSELPVAIIGAGLSGIAAGLRLRELGIDFEIFESGDGPGGRLRSDRVGEYICDRGFQLVNLSYPDLARFYQPDKFHKATKVIDVLIDGKVHRLGDPRASFSHLFTGLNPATGSISEKIRFLKFLLGLRGQGQAISGALEDESFEASMVSLGIGSLYSRVIRPFAQGVFLDRCDQISAQMANRLIYYFINGTPGLPIGGVSSLAEELAKEVNINFNSHVDEIGDGFLRIGKRKRKARRIILATDALAAKLLLSDAQLDLPLDSRIFDSMTMSTSTTWYHALDDLEFDATLRIDGLGMGPVTNSIAISKLAPEYAPPGKTLISSTVIGGASENTSESSVRRHLASIWGVETEGWELIAKYVIKKSLPNHPPGKSIGTFTPLGERILLVGDHITFPSQQGALESGVAAAEEIARTI